MMKGLLLPHLRDAVSLIIYTQDGLSVGLNASIKRYK